MDDMKQYRAVCASRVNRLERFKKTRSFCSLDQETTHDSAYTSSSERDFHQHPSSSSASSDDDDVAQDTFEMIKEKLISLMEDDVSLLQQLMALSDKINEVKKGRGLLPRSLSQTSLSDGFDREADEEEDLFDDDITFAASSSAVTTLYLNEDDEKPSSSRPTAPPPQYFSRKNSVLRIPIAPRLSNRINRRPSDMSRHTRPLHIDATAAAAAATAAAPTSTSTASAASPFTRPSPALSSTTSSASSTVSSASGVKILQRSSNSSDSGRASSGSSCGSPSPTF